MGIPAFSGREKWSPALKDWLELADNLDDQGRTFIERLDYGPIPANAYIGGYVSCHLHLTVDCARWKLGPHDFCIEFASSWDKNSICKGFADHIHDECGDHSSGVCAGSFGEGVGGDHQFYRLSVPVTFRKVSDNGNQGFCLSEEHFQVPSVVRLKSLHNCDVVRRNLPKPPFKFFEVGGVVTDRKLGALRMDQVSIGRAHSELVCELIEGLDETLKGVGKNDGTPADKIAEIRHIADVVDELSGFGVRLYPDRWGIFWDRERCPDLLIQGISMFFSPLQAKADVR